MEVRKPKCKLIRTDGNAFAIIGRVAQVLRQDNQAERAEEFVRRASGTASYDELLKLCMEYVVS